ncbi:MAG TPA: DUF4199 domain-containing protein [Thermoanaerobaculia bacterium]|nr:DUF4199 domain-containing protein [Thermoanaerobaculia bacterium]
MKKTVLTFGLAAGLVLSATLLISMPLVLDKTLTFDNAEVFGYASMLLAFLLIFFGIRSYRENNGGSITFGKAFQTGILITLLASAAYVVTWQIYFFNWGQDFTRQYTEHSLAKLKADGASDAEIAAMAKEMADFSRMYRNPLFNSAITFLEVFPLGLVVTLVSAAILRKKPQEGAATAPAPA